MYKKLCVLQVTPEKPTQKHIELFASKEVCDFYFVTHDKPHPDALKFCPDTTWAETRNVLVERVPKHYEYYAFVDYDYRIESQTNLSPLEQILKDLDSLKPAVLVPYPGENISSTLSDDKEYLKSRTYSIHAFTHAGFVIVHRSLLDWFFPMVTKFDGGWSACHLFNILAIPFLRNVVLTHNVVYHNEVGGDSDAPHNQDHAEGFRNMDRMWLWIRSALQQHNFIDVDDSLFIKKYFVDLYEKEDFKPIINSDKKIEYLNLDYLQNFFDFEHEYFRKKDFSGLVCQKSIEKKNGDRCRPSIQRNRMKMYENMYAGERAFIIGNGPSLKKMDLSKLKSEITFGVNSIFYLFDDIGFKPTFYVVEDTLVAEDRAEKINALDGMVKIFGRYLNYCLDDKEDIIWANVIFDYSDYPGFPNFSQDADNCLWVGGTVSYLCMQLSYYMGFDKVYLIGFDHSYQIPSDAKVEGTVITSVSDDPNHFHPGYFGDGKRWHHPRLDRMEQAYRKALTVFEQDERKIYNATAGGKLEIFPRCEYDRLFIESYPSLKKSNEISEYGNRSDLVNDPACDKNSDMENIRISVVICTHRNPDFLGKVLDSLKRQSLSKKLYEVIVVDNLSMDTTREVVGRFPNVQYVFEEELGLSHARNKGIKIANGDIIAFTDDDAEVSSDWLESLLHTYDTVPDAWAVGGKALPIWDADKPEWLTEEYFRSLSLIDWGDIPRPLRWPERIIGVNCSFRKMIFEEVGQFDTKLGRIGSAMLGDEDTEIQQRIHNSGKLVYYCPDAAVYHHVPASRMTKEYFQKRMVGTTISQSILTLTKQGKEDEAIKIANQVRQKVKLPCESQLLSRSPHTSNENSLISNKNSQFAKKADYIDDIINLFVEIHTSQRQITPSLIEKILPNDLTENLETVSHLKFYNTVINQLGPHSNDRSLILWIAGSIIKFYLIFHPVEVQKNWLSIFRYLLSGIEEKLHNVEINELKTSEKYLLSSFRYLVAVQLLNSKNMVEADIENTLSIHSTLIASKIWKLGCIDDKDVQLIETITKTIDLYESNPINNYDQFLVLYALMLFRKPSRIAYLIESNRIFSQYLKQIKALNPEDQNNVYLCRKFTNQNLAEEYALWYLENYEAISNYRNCHKGESCFIIGNGPSLREMDLSQLRYRKTFGLNKIFLLYDKLGFETTYLAAANPYVIQQAARDLFSLSMPMFLMMWGREFIKKKENVIFLRENSHPLFAKEITKGVCIDATVTYMAMQIAYFMGFNTVILIGVDHFFESKGQPHTTVQLSGEDPNHFDPNYFGHGVPWQLPDLAGSERAYQRAKDVYEADGRRILDATVEGKLQIFEKISYQEALDLA